MTELRSYLDCRKCCVPLEFHSTQITGGRINPHHVNVFECQQCGRLTAEEMQQLKAA